VLLLLAATVAAGLFVRSDGVEDLPRLIGQYGGDTLWAVALYLFIVLLKPAGRPKEIMYLSLLLAFGIEASQLYQAEWINAVRHTGPLGYFLGYGFLWSDILCYSTGILFCFIIDSFQTAGRRF